MTLEEQRIKALFGECSKISHGDFIEEILDEVSELQITATHIYGLADLEHTITGEMHIWKSEDKCLLKSAEHIYATQAALLSMSNELQKRLSEIEVLLRKEKKRHVS